MTGLMAWEIVDLFLFGMSLGSFWDDFAITHD